ncbi:MAG TPA: GTPase ObgE, partial [candidate division Zixibacteria bacterium]|nr:GTPase ObgE [candidate division Zixibacteria bacterium]
MLIDEAKIYVKAGDGGRGCVAFLREKYRPRGGPAGGNGGKGGDVIIRVNTKMRTLLDFYYRHHFRAENGRPGQGKNKHGRNGKDLIIEVPPGTMVYDAETGELICDLIDGEFVVARGGRGGRGNAAFATSTNQTPDYAEPGEPGEERMLRLELRLIADVGLVGLPNAGKSTLISRLTKARPKIADYPFTTKEPLLGIAELGRDKRLVIADIPGLIEGAHKGRGMGIKFLKHIARTKVLVFVIDINEKPDKAFQDLLSELGHFEQSLLRKPRIIALNKIDIANEEALERNWEEVFPGEKVFLI